MLPPKNYKTFPCQPITGHSSTSTTCCLSVLMPTIHIQVRWLTNYGFLHTKYCTIHKVFSISNDSASLLLRFKIKRQLQVLLIFVFESSNRSAKNVSLWNNFICKIYQSQVVDLLWQSSHLNEKLKVDWLYLKRYKNNRKFVQDTLSAYCWVMNSFKKQNNRK